MDNGYEFANIALDKYDRLRVCEKKYEELSENVYVTKDYLDKEGNVITNYFGTITLGDKTRRTLKVDIKGVLRVLGFDREDIDIVEIIDGEEK